MAEDFKVIGQITEIETIAIGSSIRELPELRARFGRGRWRKRKGVADVRLADIRYALPKFIGMRRTVSAKSE